MNQFRPFLVVLLACIPAVAKAQPLRVFILAGQSNMQGRAQVRTFEHIGMAPATKPLLAEMQNPDGSPKVLERVWISSIGSADTEQTGNLTTGFWGQPKRSEDRAGVHLWYHDRKVHGRSRPADQDRMGRQEPEHRFPLSERRPVGVQ